MRGRDGSAVDIDGWIRSALEPVEPPDDRPGAITEVGSESIARALIAIRDRIRSEEEAQDAIPTAPPPPQSDIRMIGGTRYASDEDPLAIYAEALGAPTLPPPRARRETMKLPAPTPTRPRQATLVMIDRPVAQSLSPVTPPMTIVPRARAPAPAEPAPPGPFRGSLPVLALAFLVGSGLALAITVMATRLYWW